MSKLKEHDWTDLVVVGASLLFLQCVVPTISSMFDVIQSKMNNICHSDEIKRELDEVEANATADTIKPADNTQPIIGFQADEPNNDNECVCHG